jgi:Flp pilus assembly pilin Flp
MNVFIQLWRDQRGAVSSMSFLLLVTIVALGMIVGLTTFRDQIVQELGDVGMALEAVNQSYSTATSSFADVGTDFPSIDVDGAPPACIGICDVSATPES